VDRRPREARERDQRGVDVRRLRVVDVEDAVDRRDLLEAVLDAREGPQRVADGVDLDPAGQRDGRRRHRVEAVVRAAQRELLDRQQRLVGPPQRSRPLADLDARPDPEADPPRAAPEVLDVQARRGDRDVVVALVGEDPQLRRPVGRERPVAVEVVGLEVEQDGALGGEEDGVLELEGRDLAHDDGLGRERVDERAERRPDVPGDGHRPPGLAVDVPDQLGRRRLAVRARHGDELVRDEPPGELDLPEDRDPARPGLRDDRRLGRDPGRLDDGAGVLELGQAVGAELRVVALGPLAAGVQHLQDREPRAGEAGHEVRPAG
jgi:hypothetical protein